MVRAALPWRALVLFLLVGCGHSHGCSGLHFPKGHGGGFGGHSIGHSLGHASSSSVGSWGGHHATSSSFGSAARALASLPGLVFHGRASATLVTQTAGDDITILAEDPGVSAELVASSDAAFWVQRGLSSPDSIVSVPLAGGFPTSLYTCEGAGEESIVSLAIDGGYVYWAESTAVGDEVSHVRRMRATGGAVEPVLARRGKIKQIALDPPYLYTLDERELRASSLVDGSERVIGAVPQVAEGPAMTARAGAVYWLGQTGASTRRITRAPSPAFVADPLASRDDPVTSMGVFGSTLYFVEYGGSSSSSSILAIGDDGGAPARLFESTRLHATSAYGHSLVAAAAGGACFMVDGSGPLNDGAIYQSSRVGGPRLVVSGVAGPGGLATSGDWLVFTDMGAGVVVRVPL